MACFCTCLGFVHLTRSLGNKTKHRASTGSGMRQGGGLRRFGHARAVGRLHLCASGRAVPPLSPRRVQMTVSNTQTYDAAYAIDRAEIEDLMARYLFAMDYNDFESYAETFTEDGELEFASGSAVGRDNIKAT